LVNNKLWYKLLYASLFGFGLIEMNFSAVTLVTPIFDHGIYK